MAFDFEKYKKKPEGFDFDKYKTNPVSSSQSGQEARSFFNDVGDALTAAPKQAMSGVGDVWDSAGEALQTINPWSGEDLGKRAQHAAGAAGKALLGVGKITTTPLAPAFAKGAEFVENTKNAAVPMLQKTGEGLGQVVRGIQGGVDSIGENLTTGFQGDTNKSKQAAEDIMFGGLKTMSGAIGTAFSPIPGTISSFSEETQTPFRMVGEAFEGAKKFVTDKTGTTGTPEGQAISDWIDVASTVLTGPRAGEVGRAVGSKLEAQISMLEKPLVPFERAVTKGVQQVDDMRTLQTLRTGKEIFGDSARKVTEMYQPKVQEFVNNTVTTFSDDIAKNGVKGSNVAQYVDDVRSTKLGLYDSLAQNMNIPILRKTTLEFVDNLDDALSRPGNQTAAMGEVQKLITLVKNNDSLRTMTEVVKKADDMLKRPEFSSQKEFLSAFKQVAMRDMDESIRVTSTNAGDMLYAIDKVQDTMREVAAGNIKAEVANRVSRGIPEAKAWLDVVPSEGNVLDYLPPRLVQQVQAAVVKDLFAKSKDGASLNPKVLYQEIGKTFQEPQLLTATTKYNLNVLQKTLLAAKDKWDDINQLVKTRVKNVEDVTDAVTTNPTLQNVQIAQTKTGLPAQDILSANIQKNSGMLDDFNKQVDVAQSNVGARGSDIRPEMVTGEKLTGVAKTLVEKKDKFGAAKDKALEKAGANKLKINDVKDDIYSMLKKEGVKISKKGELNFVDSKFADDAATQSFVEKVVRDVNKKNATVKDIDVIRQRTLYNMKNAGGITGNAPEYIKTLGERLRAQLSGKIEDSVPGYRQLNSNYARIVTALDDFFNSVGLKYSVDELNSKSLRAGEVANRIGGNASGITWDKIGPVVDLFEEFTGQNIKPEIQALVGNKSMLQQVYPDPQVENLKNQTKGSQIDIPKDSRDYFTRGIDKARSWAEGKPANPKEGFESLVKSLNKK